MPRNSDLNRTKLLAPVIIAVVVPARTAVAVVDDDDADDVNARRRRRRRRVTLRETSVNWKRDEGHRNVCAFGWETCGIAPRGPAPLFFSFSSFGYSFLFLHVKTTKSCG